ncbi:MAG: amidohydrolase family protein [Streptomycetaceae bacterium]|nr:amidohydrolase family protein [Streptomycetaceae bacterium]
MTIAPERLISADSHVRLTQDRIKAHLPSRVHDEYDGALAQLAAGMRRAAGAGAANRQSLENRSYPAAGRPGYHDARERLKDMDADGVDVEVLYCEVSGFRYLYLMKDGWREASRGFNDALAEFAAADPRRLVLSYQIPIHDIEHAVAEVARVAAAGAKSLQLPVNPSELGLPDYYHERYDPLWSTISDTGLPVCLHIGLNTNLDDLTRRDPTPQKGIMVPVTALMTAEAFGMFVCTGVLERHPGLKLVFVEPGLGWVPWWLATVDDQVTRQDYEFGLKELPSFYFHRQVHITFIEEPLALAKLRHEIGVRNILWSTDYPHPVTSWPRSRALVDEQFAAVPADERALMVSGNAMRVWNLG